MIKVLLITALILIGIAVVADIVMVIRLAWLLHKGKRELGEEKRDKALLTAWTLLETKRRKKDE